MNPLGYPTDGGYMNKLATLAAGRELDALVAEKVFGTKISLVGAVLRRWDGDPIPAYSTDIAAAWQIISEMRRRGWSFILDDMCSGKTYQCHFERERHEVYNVTDVETAPLAICLAALKAVGYDDQSKD